MTNSRDIGLKGTGAGKGDAPRTKFDKNYQDNYDAVFAADPYGERPAICSPGYKKVAPGRWRKVFK